MKGLPLFVQSMARAGIGERRPAACGFGAFGTAGGIEYGQGGTPLVSYRAMCGMSGSAPPPPKPSPVVILIVVSAYMTKVKLTILQNDYSVLLSRLIGRGVQWMFCSRRVPDRN